MKSNDYKELEAQEVKLRVELDKAKSLVSSWIGGSDSEEDEQLPTVQTKGSGLGSTAKQPPAMSAALSKLKRKNDHQQKLKHPRPADVAPKHSNSDSDSDSRTSKSRSKRVATKSAFDNYRKKK